MFFITCQRIQPSFLASRRKGSLAGKWRGETGRSRGLYQHKNWWLSGRHFAKSKKEFLLRRPRGRGVLRRGWSKDFWGFEILYSGIYLGRKIIVYIYIKYIFGWLNLGRDFVRIQNNMKLSFCIMLLMKFLVFRVLLESRRLGNLAWDFFFLGRRGGG